jgi:hypothetical protein
VALLTTAEATTLVPPDVSAHPAFTFLLDAASVRLEKACRRTFASAAVDELLDGSGHEVLVVSRPPIVTWTSLAIDAVAVDAADYVVSSSGGLLYRKSGFAWPTGRQNIRAIYTGGYATVPEPIRLATAMLATHLKVGLRITGQFSEERIGDYWYKIAAESETDLPAGVQSLIAPYVLRSVPR